jgi:D-alanyl-D-alanine carboxypeptidase
VSAYRSIDGQKYIYNKYLNEDSQENVDTYSSRPGYSEHHTREAIDLRGSFGSIEDFEKTKESKWINENSYKYGFIIRYKKGLEKVTGYKYEPWHIRYVGVEVSTEMKRKNINTLEEYYEKYINNTDKK